VPDPTLKRKRSTDPTLTRKGSLAHPGTLLLGILAIVFTAYVLGYLPQLDGVFDRVVRLTRSNGLPIAAPIVLAIVGLIVLFVLLLILRSIVHSIQSAFKSRSFAGRSPVSVQTFILSADTHRISSQVASETYNLLKPHYPKNMCIAVEDSLRRKLRLNDDNILFLQSRLLNRCDRHEVRSFDVRQIATVLDLLRHAEQAPPKHIAEPSLRRQSGVFSSAPAKTHAVSGSSGITSPKNVTVQPTQQASGTIPVPDFIPPRRFSDTGERRRATDSAIHHTGQTKRDQDIL
jgi:hypothetical protein